MICVKLAKSYESAKILVDSMVRVVAIETEYGDEVLDSSHKNVSISLNHHGSLQDNLAPAVSYKQFRKQKAFDNFIVSHIDLDVLFGLLWAGGWLKETRITIQLSELVAEADIHGFHLVQRKLDSLPKVIRDKYLAIGYLVNSWIINDNGQVSKDISKEVHKLLLRIKDIILNDVSEVQLQEIETWFAHQNQVAKNHLIEIKDLGSCNMFLYRAPFSLTTAYLLNEVKADIILQYNEQSRSLTLGCFDEKVALKYFGKTGVIKPLQQFFNEKAGGKMTVGGSPRDIDLQPEVMKAFAAFLDREYFNVPDIKSIT